MGGKNSVNNRCGIAKHFRPKWSRSCAYFIGTSSHCVFSNTIQNLELHRLREIACARAAERDPAAALN